MNQAVYAVVGIPFLSAILLALIPSYRVTAIGNVLASGSNLCRRPLLPCPSSCR